MKHTFLVASGLLFSTLLPFTASAQVIGKTDRTQAQICRQDSPYDLDGYIIGRDHGSRVNVRAGARTQHPVRYQALVGDNLETILMMPWREELL